MPLIPIGLVYSCLDIGNTAASPVTLFGFNISGTLVSAIIGMLIAFVVFEGFSLLTKLLIQHRAFGQGDTILAMIFAAWFGWKIAILTIILGLIMQVIFTIPMLIIKLANNKDKTASTSFAMLLLSAIIPIIVNHFEFANSIIVNLIFMIIVLTVAATSSIIFLGLLI
mgnify:CR=1 FL=1